MNCTICGGSLFQCTCLEREPDQDQFERDVFAAIKQGHDRMLNAIIMTAVAPSYDEATIRRAVSQDLAEMIIEHRATMAARGPSTNEGLRPGAARWLGFDGVCRCGHDAGMHRPECVVMGCGCTRFRE